MSHTVIKHTALSDSLVRREIVEGALKAVHVLTEDLDSKDQKRRAAAARDMLYAFSRLPPMPPDALALAPEEMLQRMDAALGTPQVREWLLSRGWAPAISQAELGERESVKVPEPPR